MSGATLINEEYELVFERKQCGWFIEVWGWAANGRVMVLQTRDNNLTREQLLAIADEYGFGEMIRRELRVIDAGLDEVGLP